MERYNNYHKHDMYGNVRSMDVIVKPEEYCKRAKELGHNILFTTNHGMQGNLFESYTLAQAYDLKMVVGAECYYVPDRHEKDKSNRHIILICMTNGLATHRKIKEYLLRMLLFTAIQSMLQRFLQKRFVLLERKK